MRNACVTAVIAILGMLAGSGAVAFSWESDRANRLLVRAIDADSVAVRQLLTASREWPLEERLHLYRALVHQGVIGIPAAIVNYLGEARTVDEQVQLAGLYSRYRAKGCYGPDGAEVPMSRVMADELPGLMRAVEQGGDSDWIVRIFAGEFFVELPEELGRVLTRRYEETRDSGLRAVLARQGYAPAQRDQLDYLSAAEPMSIHEFTNHFAKVSEPDILRRTLALGGDAQARWRAHLEARNPSQRDGSIPGKSQREERSREERARAERTEEKRVRDDRIREERETRLLTLSTLRDDLPEVTRAVRDSILHELLHSNDLYPPLPWWELNRFADAGVEALAIDIMWNEDLPLRERAAATKYWTGRRYPFAIEGDLDRNIPRRDEWLRSIIEGSALVDYSSALEPGVFHPPSSDACMDRVSADYGAYVESEPKEAQELTRVSLWCAFVGVVQAQEWAYRRLVDLTDEELEDRDRDFLAFCLMGSFGEPVTLSDDDSRVIGAELVRRAFRSCKDRPGGASMVALGAGASKIGSDWMPCPELTLRTVSAVREEVNAHPDLTVRAFTFDDPIAWRDLVIFSGRSTEYRHPRNVEARDPYGRRAILGYRDAVGWRFVEVNPNFAD